jgi:uncharacterized membrane protein YoaK (UPF0700 family)
MNTVITDAWRTIVPGAKDKNGPLAPLLLALTLVTGLVDSFSYRVLGHVFVANMTGNVVFVGFAVAGTPGFSLVASVAALGAFSVGAVLGGRLSMTYAHNRGRLLVIVSAVEALLVTIAVVVVAVVHQPGTGGARYTLIMVLGLAMGAQNAMARKLAVPDLTTTVLTMTLTGIAADSRLAGGPGSKIGRRLVSTLSMFVGALAGALLVVKVSRVWAVVVALVVLATVALVTGLMSRSDPPWIHPTTGS